MQTEMTYTLQNLINRFNSKGEGEERGPWVLLQPNGGTFSSYDPEDLIFHLQKYAGKKHVNLIKDSRPEAEGDDGEGEGEVLNRDLYYASRQTG